MPLVTNGAVDIHYEVEGTGPPLVVGHAFSDSIDGMRELGYTDALRGSHRLILIDARGHGASDKPHNPAAYGLRQRPADVIAVLDALGIERADYVGYSLGGWIGLGVAMVAPARVRSLVVGGAQPYGQSMQQYRDALAGGLDGWLAAVRAMAGTLSPAMEDRIARNDLAALRASVSDDRPDISDALPAMTMPCLLYAGGTDPLCPLIERCAAELADARLIRLPGLNHIQGAVRSDLVLPHIAEFLAVQDDATRGRRTAVTRLPA